MNREQINKIIRWLLIPVFLGLGLLIGWLLSDHLPPAFNLGIVAEEPFVIPAAARGQLELYVLAGQSNMSGRGELAGDLVTHPQVFLFGNDYRWQLAREPLDHSRDQVDLVSLEPPNDEAGYGPGMAFALALLEDDPERQIGLIPCAKGGTTIAEWAPSLATTTLYGSCLQRIRAAQQMGQLASVLFFQGENDALAEDTFPADQVRTAAGYSQLFSAWIEQIRLDLGQPDLPVIFAQIGAQNRPEIFINWQIVQQEQAKVDLPCTTMITTSDLTLRDFVHYTAASYDEIGKRFARAYLATDAQLECKG